MTILNNLPWVWLFAMILFIIIEALTAALTTIWFALSSFVMIFVSLLPLPFKWQLVIFIALSLIFFIFTRPILAKKFSKRTAFNTDRLIGKKALVTQKITELDAGEVKVQGVLWRAKSQGGAVLETGAECEVVLIEGNTLVVKSI